MTIIYRKEQQEYHNALFKAWEEGNRNVAVVAPCGSGKTHLMSGVAHAFQGPVCLIAHRQELIEQASESFAARGLAHRIIANDNTIKACISRNYRMFKKNLYDPQASIAVTSVDTITRRAERCLATKNWLARVRLWMVDECHHLIRDNKWGRSIDLMPMAKGAGFTATLERADKQGLGSHADGFFDSFIELYGCDHMIRMGHLSRFEVVGIPDKLKLSAKDVGASGDWSKKKVGAVLRKYPIVGDVVGHYIRWASDRRCLVFAANLYEADIYQQSFSLQGIRAATLHGGSKPRERIDIYKDFKDGEYSVLINVDLVGEGVDLPYVDAVILARPTASFPLYVQQICRPLRAPGLKPNGALIIDAVGNVARHRLGFLKAGRATLERGNKSNKYTIQEDVVLCLNTECMRYYRATLKVCPHCSKLSKVDRKARTIEYCDGDLELLMLDELTEINKLVEEVELSDEALEGKLRSVPDEYKKKLMLRSHADKRAVSLELRDAIALWAGKLKLKGMKRSEIRRLFFNEFGVDVLTARTLTRKEMLSILEGLAI